MYRSFYWKIPDNNKIYLTFDDGPIPDVTEWVLQILGEKGVPATFFCVGDNIHKHPDIFEMIAEGGYDVGNHTFHHMDGWRTTAAEYLDNIGKCQSYFDSAAPRLFRPPYGRINHKASKTITQDYKVVMWDVLMGDFDHSLDRDKAIERCVGALEDGSIVLFHDSIKAERNMKYMLPRFIDDAVAAGFTFSKLPWC